MIRRLQKIPMMLTHAIRYRLAAAMHQMTATGLILAVGFPLLYWIWTEYFPQPWESWSLRLVGCVTGCGLLLAPYWPIRWQMCLPWYWFFTLLYGFSFFAALLFLNNNASVISAMSLLCSVFLLILLLDLRGLLVILVIGWAAALWVWYVSSPWLYLGDEHIEMLVWIVCIIVAGCALNHKTAMLQQQRMAGMAAAAGMIAHELRTPLLGIKSGAKAILTLSPALLNAWDVANQQGLVAKTVRASRIQQLPDINQRIIHEVEYANTIIDMLLIKAGRENALQHCHLEPCSMAKCIEEALARYPFKSAKQRTLISWQGDFMFLGVPLLMQHILFNLIKNALYAIETAQKGTISIWVAAGSKMNSLYVRDTGKGMTEKQQKQLFQHFYSTTFMGTGLGLSFCQLVMTHFEGTIFCEAKEGCYTQFMLSFPKISSL